ncbi:MAG TPA: rRNA maturation RNase YbeY, partial [Candidatus Omnitrophota bacterium]|nr:rRNA maturation RNase YbeY [Candidatus Omnitrophota bacterium]
MPKKVNSVTIANVDPRFKFRKKKLIQLVRSVLKKVGYLGVALSVVFVTDSEIKRLNQRHLNHAWVTDVLAFAHFRRRTSSSSRKVLAQRARSAFSNPKGVPSSFLGEVIISPKRAKIYSQKFNISYQEELV